MKVHVYDFRWNNENEFEFQASLGNQFGKKVLHLGDKLSIEVCSTTNCAGSMYEEVWKPCPQQNTGKKKCDLCRNREKNFIFTSFNGFNAENYSPEDLNKIAGPHLVYLALFSKELIKIGVCKAERKILRQVEQGSAQTLFIAQAADGVAARQIETLFRNKGLADKINASTKKNFIIPEIDKTEGKQLLEKIFEEYKETCKEFPLLTKFLSTPNEFIDWNNTYGIPAIKESPKSFHSLKLNHEESVSGKIVATKGPFIILETPDELVSICAKDLIGKIIEFEEKPAGLSLNTAFQNSLF